MKIEFKNIESVKDTILNYFESKADSYMEKYRRDKEYLYNDFVSPRIQDLVDNELALHDDIDRELYIQVAADFNKTDTDIDLIEVRNTLMEKGMNFIHSSFPVLEKMVEEERISINDVYWRLRSYIDTYFNNLNARAAVVDQYYIDERTERTICEISPFTCHFIGN